jgi:hypothetical protein
MEAPFLEELPHTRIKPKDSIVWYDKEKYKK